MDPTQYVNRNNSWSGQSGEIFRSIVARVSADINRPLNNAELDIVKRNQKGTSQINFTREKYVSHVANLASRDIAQMYLNSKKAMDIHELQKKMMNEEEAPPTQNALSQALNSFNPNVDISGFLGSRTLENLIAKFNPQLAEEEALIVLDSRYRSTDTDGTKLFRWTLSNSIQPSPGTVNNTNTIRNLKKIRVEQVRIPYSASGDSYYNRIAMNITEFNSQAAIMNEGGYIHFMFVPYRDGNFIELIPTNSMASEIRFRQPIKNINTLTLQFSNPVQPITFAADRSNAIVYQYGTETIIRTTQPHNLSTGDLVIFSDFTTQNSNGDYVIINAINSNDGVNIDVSQGLANPATDFSIDINTSSLLGTGSGTVAATINSTSILGNGTNFTSFFKTGDKVTIGNATYTVSQVLSPINLTLTTPYGGVTASGLTYTKNNTISGLQFLCYFAFQRFIINMYLTYINEDS